MIEDSAVHRNDLRRDKARIIRSQERYCTGDVVARAVERQKIMRGQPFEVGRRHSDIDLLPSRSLDDTRCDRVTPDAELAVLCRNIAGQTVNRRL